MATMVPVKRKEIQTGQRKRQGTQHCLVERIMGDGDANPHTKAMQPRNKAYLKYLLFSWKKEDYIRFSTT